MSLKSDLETKLLNLIGDAAVFEAVLPVLANGQSVDLNLAQNVKELLPKDSFSISQFAFGTAFFGHAISNVLGRGETLLDLGCGAGIWSLSAAPYFKNIYGYDLDRTRIIAARELAKSFSISSVEFFEGDILNLTLEPNFADVCLCYCTLQGLGENQAAFLKEVRKMVRLGGRLFVGFPSDGYLAWILERTFRSRRVFPPGAALKLVLNRILYGTGCVSQPSFYIPQRLFEQLACEAGWSRVECLEENVGTFPKTYRGQNFFLEYILS